MNTPEQNIVRIPQRIKQEVRAFREHPKYDEKYCKEYEATFAGVFFFVIPILFMLFCTIKIIEYKQYDFAVQTILIGGFILRVFATLWVAKLSKDLNRNSLQWIAFSFLLPGSALIIIGQKKRFYAPGEWKKHLYNHKRKITIATPQEAILPLKQVS